MTYSSDEIESGVSQVVQGAPTFSRDGLGGRNVKDRFDETRELVNSVLLYEPDSVFYLIQKAAIRTRRLLNSTLSIIDELEDDIDGMAVPSKAVNDTTALADAGNALSTISNALERRGSISDAEWQRYDRATNRALDTFKDSAKRTYTPFSGTTAITDVVKSSAESATLIQSNFNSLKSAYETLLTAVDRLVAGFGSYNHKRVVTAVASRQVSRLQSEMSTLESTFDSQSADARAATVRTDTLTVLTNRASVKALAQIRYPGDPKLQQASGTTLQYRGSAYGTGGAPAISGTISAPWPILDTHELKVDFGGTDVTVPLVPSTAGAVPGIKAASITGYVSESSTTFAINGALDTPWPLVSAEISTGSNYTAAGNFLYLNVDGTQYKIAMATDTATALAALIDAAVPGVTATGETNGSDDWIQIAYDTPSSTYPLSNRYMQVASGPDDATALGTWEVLVSSSRQTGLISSGWSGNDELWLWPNDVAYDPSTETGGVKVSLTGGTWPDYVVTAASVQGDINGATSEVQATVDSGRIKITSADVGEGSIVKIITSALSSGRKTPSILGAETLGFFKDQEVRESDFRTQSLIDVLNNNSDFSAQAVASVDFEELVNSNRAYGFSANSVKVPAESTLTATAGELKLTVEAGENAGTYGISSFTYASGELEVTLDRNLRAPTAEGLRVRIYKELLVVTSTSNGTSAYIEVDETHGNTAHIVLGLPEDSATGDVTQIWIEYNDPAQGWVSADLRGRGIKVGDVIYLEDDSTVATVTGIGSLESGILDVTAVDPNLTLTNFTIESVSFGNHGSFSTELSTWRDGLSTEEESLSALEKSINILIKIKNPDRGRVQVAANELAAIRDLLDGSSGLDSILEDYSVPGIPAVDRALDVMSEQGHDRARDLLTSAQFAEYNRTTYKTASTSGAMMDAASKVAANDFVEPTKTHPEFTSEIDKPLSYTFDEVDPKYDFRDTRADSAPVYLDYFSTDVPRR